KQYGGDVTVELILWWLASRVEEGEFRWRRFVALGVAGGAALFFSHAAGFVLAGLGLAALLRRGSSAAQARQLPGMIRAAAIWAAAFASMYALSLHRYAGSESLVRYFTQRLEGFPPGGVLAGMMWFFGRISQVFVYPGSLDRDVAVLAAVFGLIVCF